MMSLSHETNADRGIAMFLCLKPTVEPNEKESVPVCVSACCWVLAFHTPGCIERGLGVPFRLLGNCFVGAAFHRRVTFPVTMEIRTFLLFPSVCVRFLQSLLNETRLTAVSTNVPRQTSQVCFNWIVTSFFFVTFFPLQNHKKYSETSWGQH